MAQRMGADFSLRDDGLQGGPEDRMGLLLDVHESSGVGTGGQERRGPAIQTVSAAQHGLSSAIIGHRGMGYNDTVVSDRNDSRILCRHGVYEICLLFRTDHTETTGLRSLKAKWSRQEAECWQLLGSWSAPLSDAGQFADCKHVSGIRQRVSR